MGDASIASINYERLFALRSFFILAGRLGAGYHGRSFNDGFTSGIFSLSHHLTCNFGKMSFMAEIGIGGTLFTRNNYRSYSFYPIAGFRTQPLLKMMASFRLFTILPIGGFHGYAEKISPIGLSLGLNF